MFANVGFNTEKTLTYVYNVVMARFVIIEEAFGLSGFSNKFKSAYSQVVEASSVPMPKVATLSEQIKKLIGLPSQIKEKYDKHVWGSSDFQYRGDKKDKQYISLKKALKTLDEECTEMKSKGNAALNTTLSQIGQEQSNVNGLEEGELKTWRQQKLKDLNGSANQIFQSLQESPYEYVAIFAEAVRKVDKGGDSEVGLAITRKDADRRINLLKSKHWPAIQNKFINELIDLCKTSNISFDKDLSDKFKQTGDLVIKCIARGKKLMLQLDAKMSSADNLSKESIETCVINYFVTAMNGFDKLFDLNDPKDQNQRTVPIGLDYETFSAKCDTEIKGWKTSVYCIELIYGELLKLVNTLILEIREQIKFLEEIVGESKKPKCGKLAADLTGKLATVAAFTGPLVGVCPIFGAIWGIVAISGTIVQMAQTAYNYHKAKKAAEVKALEPKKSEESAEPADKHHENDEKPDDTGEAKEEVDTKTDNADVEKSNDEISKLKTINKKLEDQNKKLISENENYKQQIKILRDELAKLKSKNA